MTDIVSSIAKIQVEETDFNSAVSEATVQKIGAAINAIQDNVQFHVELKTASGNWTCPAGVSKIIVHGVGGGGGGGEGNGSSPGSLGNDGGNTTFNAQIVATGGRGGRGGTATAPGRALDGGGAATIDGAGFGCRGHLLEGTVYGNGGDGGAAAASGPNNGSGGGCGRFGVRYFSVTAGNIYAFAVGAGGNGGSGGGTGLDGSAGSAGALLIIY